MINASLKNRSPIDITKFPFLKVKAKQELTINFEVYASIHFDNIFPIYIHQSAPSSR